MATWSASQGEDRTTTAVVLGARLAWLALAVLGGAAFGAALETRSRAVQLTGTAGLWVGWAIVALALLVPSTAALTVVRAIAPMGVVAALVATVASADRPGGLDVLDTVLCLVLVGLVTALVSSGEFGQRWVQGSAYGDEERFVLRPPVPYLLPMAVSWCVLCAATICGPLLLAAGATVAGAVVSLVGLALWWLLVQRFHRLSRRWVVVVPAGLVVHDRVVLAETAMFASASLRAVGLALEGTEAADLTGPAGGNAVEVAVSGAPTVVLAPTPSAPRGTAIHVHAFLVAPTRPGRMLRAAARRGFPVG